MSQNENHHKKIKGGGEGEKREGGQGGKEGGRGWGKSQRQFDTLIKNILSHWEIKIFNE